MIKKILIVLILFLTCLTTGCNRLKTLVLFNNNPITKENISDCATEFETGRRIYYLFVTDKPLDTKFIRVEILKRDEKANFAITKLVYSNDFRLYKDQIYYYNDYIVMNSPGYYFMVIFSKNNLTRPLVKADFRVK